MTRQSKFTNNEELIALSVVLNDKDIIDKGLISKAHFRTFRGYAACYSTKPENWENKYKSLHQGVVAELRKLIDNEGYTVKYIKSPINKASGYTFSRSTCAKEESSQCESTKICPSTTGAVELFGPVQPKSIGTPSKTDVELPSEKDMVNLMCKALDTISKLCDTIRGVKHGKEKA